jgi:hypothetical protein
MLSKEKNDIIYLKKNQYMKRTITAIIAILLIASCKNEKTAEEQSAQKQKEADSVSRVAQKIVSDSLKKTNPLLIMPPDSEYTGDYVDKYPAGIIKFKGFFRQGERHGQWMSFYPTGVLWSEMTYDKGVRTGLNRAYYNTGKKRYEGTYKNDRQDSVWIYYDTAEVVVEKVLYKEDLIVKKLKVEKTRKKKKK